jgi:hypothetical protein
MGSYLIPAAPSINEAAAYIGEPPLTATWERVGADVLFTDTARTNAQCAAAYAGYVPSGLTDAEYIPPLSPALAAARDTLRTFWNANPASVTDAQTATILRAMLVVLRDMNRRLD